MFQRTQYRSYDQGLPSLTHSGCLAGDGKIHNRHNLSAELIAPMPFALYWMHNHARHHWEAEFGVHMAADEVTKVVLEQGEDAKMKKKGIFFS